ncbi:MAG: NTP transferase domain-containing protein [Alphaproteobacteria bacterium]
MSGLRGGIIAAGHGERLKAGGWQGPKPLLPIAGRPLIGHAVDNLVRAGVSRIDVIFNEESSACAEWLRINKGTLAIDIILRSTPSSFESFRLIAERLRGAPAIVTTVDGIMDKDALIPVAEALASSDELVLGVTDHVDDEKPLWISRDEKTGRVIAIGEERGNCVSAGVYGLPAGFTLPVAAKYARLRDFLVSAVESGSPVSTVMLTGVIDVDRLSDAAAAERRYRAVAPVRSGQGR